MSTDEVKLTKVADGDDDDAAAFAVSYPGKKKRKTPASWGYEEMGAVRVG